MRRFRGRAARPKRALDWVVGAWTGPDIQSNMLFNNVEPFALLDGADVAEHDDNFTVERIRGSCSIGGFHDPGGGIIRWPQILFGVLVQEADAVDQILPMSLAESVNADAGWMWIQAVTTCCRKTTSPGAVIADEFLLDFGWDVDIKSKRKMTGRDILVGYMYVSSSSTAWPATGSTPNDQFVFNAHLRVLVKLT